MSIVGTVLSGLNREVVSIGRLKSEHCRDIGLDRDVLLVFPYC